MKDFWTTLTALLFNYNRLCLIFPFARIGRNINRLTRFYATLFLFTGLINNVNDNIGNNPGDKQLVDRVLRGDNGAFAIIIKNTENLVAQIVFKMVSVAEDRKDIAQDIYMKTFHSLGGFKFQSKLSTWIARIAYNTCLSWIEKKKPVLAGNFNEPEAWPNQSTESQRLYMGAINESESRIFQKELTDILRIEVDKLPPIYQTMITLFHHESMSYEELTQVTGLPEGTVKSHLFRARKMLKENILSKYKKEAL